MLRFRSKTAQNAEETHPGRTLPEGLFIHVAPRGSPTDGPSLIQALTNAVRPHIEYQQWKTLQNFLPEKIRVLDHCQSRETVVATMAARLANAHDVAILSSRLLHHAATSRDGRFFVTARIAWVDNDSWISEGAEIKLRISLEKQEKYWKASGLDMVGFSPLALALSPSPLSSQSFAAASASHSVLVCTSATERRSGLADLEQSCARAGISLRVFSKGGPWRGFNYNKLKGLYWELEKHHHEYEYALFTDGYDSIIASNLDCIVQKFRALDTPLLFSAEVNCFPSSPGQKEDDYPESPTKYRFLNGGGFMGRVDYLLKLMREWDAKNSADSGIDQQWWAHLYLSGMTRIRLDHHCQIFQCLFMCEDDLELHKSGIRNRITGSSPCIVHGNGGASLGPAADLILGRSRSKWGSIWRNLPKRYLPF